MAGRGQARQVRDPSEGQGSSEVAVSRRAADDELNSIEGTRSSTPPRLPAGPVLTWLPASSFTTCTSTVVPAAAARAASAAASSSCCCCAAFLPPPPKKPFFFLATAVGMLGTADRQQRGGSKGAVGQCRCEGGGRRATGRRGRQAGGASRQAGGAKQSGGASRQAGPT